MTWTFDPADLKTVDLKDTAPGDILCPMWIGDSCELWLRLTGEDSKFPIVHLTGLDIYKVRHVNTSYKTPVLRIAEGKNLRVEIQEKKGIGSSKHELGELLINDSGAHLVAKIQYESYSTDTCYVSLGTWEEKERVNSNSKGSFFTWKLVDISDPDNKKTLLSVGDWNDEQVIQP